MLRCGSSSKSALWHGDLAHRYLRSTLAWRRGASDLSSARQSCPQVPQWHLRVARLSGTGVKPGSDWSPGRLSARPPCPYAPQGIPAWRSGLLAGFWHGHIAHKPLRGIPAWRSGLLAGPRHGAPAYRYLSGIPTWRDRYLSAF